MTENVWCTIFHPAKTTVQKKKLSILYNNFVPKMTVLSVVFSLKRVDNGKRQRDLTENSVFPASMKNHISCPADDQYQQSTPV